MIILAVNRHPEASELPLNEPAELLGIPKSSFYWHVKNLIEDGLFYPRRHGRTVSIILKVDVKLVDQLSGIIVPSRWDRFLDDVDAFFSFSST